MKHLLIILSILLLSSPLFGQSSKYESVSQCVLQTMKERELTGNEMFKMVLEECERILGKVKGKGKKRQKGVLFFINRNRIVGWYEDGDEKRMVNMLGKLKIGNQMVKEHTVIPMGRNMWVNGRAGCLGLGPNTTKMEKS